MKEIIKDCNNILNSKEKSNDFYEKLDIIKLYKLSIELYKIPKSHWEEREKEIYEINKDIGEVYKIVQAIAKIEKINNTCNDSLKFLDIKSEINKEERVLSTLSKLISTFYKENIDIINLDWNKIIENIQNNLYIKIKPVVIINIIKDITDLTKIDLEKLLKLKSGKIKNLTVDFEKLKNTPDIEKLNKIVEDIYSIANLNKFDTINISEDFVEDLRIDYKKTIDNFEKLRKKIISHIDEFKEKEKTIRTYYDLFRMLYYMANDELNKEFKKIATIVYNPKEHMIVDRERVFDPESFLGDTAPPVIRSTDLRIIKVTDEGEGYRYKNNIIVLANVIVRYEGG